MKDLVTNCVVAMVAVLAFGPGLTRGAEPGAAPRIQGLHRLPVTSGTRSLATANPRTSITEALADLENDPDNAETQVRLANSYVRAGLPADALPAFAFALGAERYETVGLTYHADALRALGRGREAAAIRQARREGGIPTDKDIASILAVIIDLKTAGDLAGAVDAAEEATALYPDMGVTHVYLADLLLDLGLQDEAEFEVWMADLYGTVSSRGVVLRARVATMYGGPEDGEAILSAAMRKRRGSLDVTVALAETWLRQGQPDAALTLFDWYKWRYSFLPEIESVRVRALADMGEQEEAIFLCRRIVATFRPLPAAMEAARYVEDVTKESCNPGF